MKSSSTSARSQRRQRTFRDRTVASAERTTRQRTPRERARFQMAMKRLANAMEEAECATLALWEVMRDTARR